MASPQKIVTRFAPSPTGYLHIGGARTALFNWLFAKGAHAAAGSQFLLRIEDTDRARHNEAAVAAITEGLSWLGLDWDGEVISQFARADRHAAIAHRLLDEGKAYKCWLAGEALDQARAAARAQNARFTSPWRDRDDEGEGPYSVRLKLPLEGDTVIDDAVQGEVRFPNTALDDMVILRSDGTPTYMLAVVVDDHDMDVTHIIRGDDHLINAARQFHLYEAAGWPVPVFAHIPLIHGLDGKKLSKRHGALGIESYREDGFLPEGLRNALLRLGWSHGDAEIISTEEALKWFGLEGIGKAPARLDPDRFRSINGAHLQKMAPDAFLAAALPFLPVQPSPGQKARLTRGAAALQERCQLLTDIAEAAAYLLIERPITPSGKAAKPLKQETAPDVLKAAHHRLNGLEAWTAAALDTTLKALAEDLSLSFGKVGPPLRVAVAGGLPSPDLGLTLEAIGREETLARLADRL
ncbi:Glutamyl-tRNA synthetase [Parvularcula bermudensis HTCC2503]|uniref:Glutamate--tRNA ligase n=1 Tax=Parvularcula bermudensis (strain ATCC BAA-594 / HTCC2503 / KCTC 12087) TaxID=314260 RepID=E0TG22_PARBH|nr:glutamate--tRNA ligase [Parvularcula bermudensis]ADM10593.1 Glutamyl-tRNA synthetase [Parvularcula bermudensis HTCC2503]